MAKFNSKHLKISALAYFRYKRQFHYVATEVGGYSADFVALCLKKNRFIEVEIKMSKADLLNDFKKMKHEIYLNYKNNKVLPIRKWKQQWIPREFYFLVPEKLTEYALNAVEDLPYGVMEYTHPILNKGRNSWFENRIRVIQKAKRLHKNPIMEQTMVIDDMISRMSSELCRSYQDLEKLRKIN